MPDGDKLDRSRQLKARSKQFALRVIRLFDGLPSRDAARVIGRQLLRSATSVGANYRAACRARTTKEFAMKMRIVVEEADETAYWLELLIEAEVMPVRRLSPLLIEANELLAIFAASLRTVQSRSRISMIR